MDKNIFKVLIKEGQEELNNVELNQRHFEFEEHGRYVLVGVRQAGKSYLLYQRAKMLLETGHSISELVYINFDDERLLGMAAEDFDLILQAYATMYDSKPILFFDEIQNIEGWEHFARRLANQKYMVFITGSNAKMLSRDIATTLGARFLDKKVFPLSFVEFLEAKGVTLQGEWEYSKQRNDIQRVFYEYFQWGGFPELLMYRNKRAWLNSLYEKIILGDVIQRYNVKNGLAIRLAIKRLAENVKQPVAYNRLANLVKSVGVPTNTASIIEYVRYVKDSCLIFTLDNYASKFAKKESIKKHYFTDNGLLNIFLNDANASLLENLCAITLFRHYNCDNSEAQVYYYNRNIEVDFYIPNKGIAIQASYDISDEGTRKREVTALVKLNSLKSLKEAYIITFDQEEIIEHDGLIIKVLPAWKWIVSFETRH